MDQQPSGDIKVYGADTTNGDVCIASLRRRQWTSVSSRIRLVPVKPLCPCSKNGCPNLASKRGLCEQHVREYNEHRHSEPTLYDTRWAKIRQLWLIDHPLCVECNKKGQQVLATEVHHIKPLSKGGTHNFDNLMSLCKSCHSKITVQGDTYRA